MARTHVIKEKGINTTMPAKKYRDIKKEFPIDEGKLVSGWNEILKVVTDKIQSKLGKEYQKNPEKGVAMINTLGAMVGAKVTDKKQQKGKLFLKFGDDIQEDAAVDAANLKAKQTEEMERLKEKQQTELESLKDRHEREMDRINDQKEKEAANKAIDAERESARKAATSEEVKEDKEEQDRDVSKNKGTQPKKYYKGLDKETKQKRDAHFKAKKSGPAPGDEDEDGEKVKTKKSTHTKKFDKMFGGK